ncbi:SPOR domain-containing protein [Chromohalobacter israelensis]|uniref:SPOR domain-containing protein n=1 Tax=Chromohalobacter israelensis TaxID=141390 RepID=UPI0015C45C20|nr:SPOR domain-containing protein [Chromohalobacter salexigens]NWO54915.1 acetyl-CoA carboxylase subunit beta [Chromohalobacter salexigens]
MKYGMRERISGAIILVALAVIFLPMLFDEPTPRSERPEPVLTIEQPIPVDQRDVEAPTPPEALDGAVGDGEPPVPATEAQLGAPDGSASEASPPASDEAEPAEDAADRNADAPGDEDPIAAIAQQSTSSPEERASNDEPSATPQASGGWAVQVGSFGQPGNAERLVEQLSSQGFNAYQRPRDNDLTTVYVGPFDSSDEGERVRTQLKEDANIQGLLIRVRED